VVDHAHRSLAVELIDVIPGRTWPSSIRTMTSPPPRASVSTAASSSPTYRAAMRRAVSVTPSSMNRAPFKPDSAPRGFGLGHNDGRSWVAPQVPDFHLLRLDSHGDGTIAPFVPDRGQ
jgi:hypothetical protein